MLTRWRRAAFAKSWLSTGLARGDWSETTARRYAESLDLHILPRLGGAFVDALKPRDVERAIAEWASKYERATVNGWLRVLRTVLNAAMAGELVPANPASAVRALRERTDDEGARTTGRMPWRPRSSMRTSAVGARSTRSTSR